MTDRNPGLITDPLFVGVTRPPMRWGTTYAALLVNMVITLEVFLLTKNLLTLFLCVPIHGVCLLLCARDARFFDLILLWARSSVPGWLTTTRYWRASSLGPLRFSRPGPRTRSSQIRVML